MTNHEPFNRAAAARRGTTMSKYGRRQHTSFDRSLTARPRSERVARRSFRFLSVVAFLTAWVAAVAPTAGASRPSALSSRTRAPNSPGRSPRRRGSGRRIGLRTPCRRRHRPTSRLSARRRTRSRSRGSGRRTTSASRGTRCQQPLEGRRDRQPVVQPPPAELWPELRGRRLRGRPCAEPLGSRGCDLCHQAVSRRYGAVGSDRRADDVARRWLDHGRVDGFDRQRRRCRVRPVARRTQTGSTGETTYSFGGLSCNRSYTLGVVARDGNGNVSPQTLVLMSTAGCVDSQPPSAPGPCPRPRSTGRASVQLDGVTDDRGVAGYRVLVNGSAVGTTTGTTYRAQGLSVRRPTRSLWPPTTRPATSRRPRRRRGRRLRARRRRLRLPRRCLWRASRTHPRSRRLACRSRSTDPPPAAPMHPAPTSGSTTALTARQALSGRCARAGRVRVHVHRSRHDPGEAEPDRQERRHVYGDEQFTLASCPASSASPPPSRHRLRPFRRVSR